MQTGVNTSTMLDGWLERGWGEHTVAITSDDERWSAARLHAAICSVAAHLQEIAVRREQRVLMVMDDTPAFPAVFLGAMRMGAVPIPVNFLGRSEDFGYYLDDSYAAAVVVDDAFRAAVAPQVEARPNVRLLVVNGGGTDETIDGWLSDGSAPTTEVRSHPDDPAFWLYSSGSTGRPKGVVHRHGDVRATCELYAQQVLGMGKGDVVFSSTKMFHAYGLGNNLTFPMWTGATAVYATGRPTPDRLLERLASHRPNLYFSVPALYNAMLAHPTFDAADWSSVRLGISAAEPLPSEIWRQFRDRTGIEILDGVGSTEMLHIYCSNRAGEVKPGTSGRPVPGYELEIRDPEGAVSPTGEAGEMRVKGPSTMAAYWHQHSRTRSKLVGEWFATGDRYRVDSDGYYTYEGRSDDMMKIGGLWVSPIEIENSLMEHPAVREAAVVQVQIDLDSRIKATVILSEAAQKSASLTSDLQDWCKGDLQRYQYPHLIEFVEDFPRTATGKIQRFKLRV